MNNRTSPLMLLLAALGDVGAKHDERPALQAIAERLDVDTVEGLARLLSRLTRDRRQFKRDHARAVAELRKIRAAIVEAEKQAAPIARELDEARIELARWRAHFGDVDAATSRRFAFGDGAGEVAR